MRHSTELIRKDSSEDALGGGISRACKCDDSLAIFEVVYEDNGQNQSSDTD